MAHTNNDETKKIPLGSGYVYIVESSGTIPADNVFETDANRLGYISGGASIEYKPTVYTAKDDLNKVNKTVMTDEEATLKLGLITWNASTLDKLSATGTVTTSGQKRTIKIGGIANQNNKKFAIRFVNPDKVDGDIRVTIVGQNQAGFSLSFTKDKENIINPEFKALPLDNDGTLIIYEEEILSVASLAISLVAGTAGKTKVSLVSPTLEVGNSYKYKLNHTASISFDDVLTTGWAALTVGTTEISTVAGDLVVVAEVNTSNNKAKKVGAATVIDNIG